MTNWHNYLLNSSFVNIVHIEFTSHCNLRCVYCASIHSGYEGREYDRKNLALLLQQIITMRPRVCCVNGHGETTIYPDWAALCDQLLSAGLNLHIITNLCKKLSDAEIATLARFSSIEVSCDTTDEVLFARLRRNGSLPTLVWNIVRIRAAALQQSLKSPSIGFSCVVSDQNIFELPNYQAFVETLGATKINFCNLTKYADLPDQLNPQHISELPHEKLLLASESIQSAIALMKKKGIAYFVQPGLIDVLNDKIQASDHIGDKQPLKSHESKRYSVRPQTGMTRDCLDPWSFMMFSAAGEISPCCWHKPFDRFDGSKSLNEIFNNEVIQGLRRELLTGKLSEDCLSCPSRGWVSIASLKRKVIMYFLKNKFRQLREK